MSQIAAIGYSASYSALYMDSASGASGSTGATGMSDALGSSGELLSLDGAMAGATDSMDLEQTMEMLFLLLVLSVLMGDQGGDELMQTATDLLSILGGGEQTSMAMSFEASFSMSYASDGSMAMPADMGTAVDSLA